MEKIITERLKEIEKKENIHILTAVESGSRAWGFSSPDSDYDVRFIYIRSEEDYLRLEPFRDVIELPPDGVLDINGWDLRKTLKLLYKSKEIEKCLKILKEIYPAEYSKKEADEAFRKIQSITVMPDSIYDANIKVIEEVENNYKIDERLKEKIRDLTVSLNCYYGKYPPNVDRKPISEKSILNEIHRTSLKYEFDTEKGKGRGLLFNEIENEVMIF